MSAPTEPLLRLDDYVTGDMSEAEARTFEADLFAAVASDADSPADVFKRSGLVADAGFLDRLARLASNPDELAAFAGGFARAQVDGLLGSPLPVHYVDLGAGGASVFPSWGADVKFVIARLAVDLRGWQDVDIEVTTADGTPVKTFRDVHCAPEDGALYAICHAPLARLAFARGRSISRVIATRDGTRETVAVFDLQPATV
jgi:hypothetical protein